MVWKKKVTKNLFERVRHKKKKYCVILGRNIMTGGFRVDTKTIWEGKYIEEIFRISASDVLYFTAL